MAFMSNPLGMVNAIAAVVPAGILFFVAYGRYDGMFADQTVFLHFVGGMLVGGFVGVLTILAASLNAALLEIVLLATLYPLVLVAAVNRRKWQGQPHAVFNGGALGLGVAVMVSFSLIFRLVTTLEWGAVGHAVVLATALACLFFATGLVAGDGVHHKAPFRATFTGAAALIAPAIFLEEYLRDGAWLWVILLAAYGIIYAIAAERRLMARGLTDDNRRLRRRKQRQGA